MKRILLFTLTACFALSMTAQTFPKLDEGLRLKRMEPPKGKVRMVLDTDAYNEVDDQFAICYAYLSPDKIDLEAVYAAPFRNQRSTGPGDGMEKSYEEILRLLKLLGKTPEGFAFRGSDRYLEDPSRPVDSEAVRDLIERALASPPDDPLYVVPIGCITNVASAILIEPEIIKHIVVVWLGGNSLDWPHTREFNYRQDLAASRVVLDCGVPFVMMPCQDVVTHLRTTVPEMEYYLAGKNALSDYLLDIVVEYSKGRKAWSKVIWDVSAVAWLVNPDWISTNLVHSPIATDQMTFSVDRSRHFIRIAYGLNRDAIFKDLFTKLENHQSE